jgi:hypothetical protein
MTDPVWKLELLAKRIEPKAGYQEDGDLFDALEADREAMAEFREIASLAAAVPFYELVDQSAYGRVIVDAVLELGLLPTDARNFLTVEQLQSTESKQMQQTLCSACIFDDTRAVEFFASKIDVNVLDQHKQLPLTYAVGNNHINCVRILLRHGANPNLVQNWGNTSMHICACCISSKEIFQLLIDAGGDITIRNDSGKTPIQAMGRKKRREWGF